MNKSKQTMFSWLFVGGCLSLMGACNATSQTGGERAGGEQTGKTSDELYVASTKIWPSRSIGVCWADDGWGTEKAWVRDAIARTWERESGVAFTGWGSCNGSSAIHIVVRDDGPRTLGLGTDLNGVGDGMLLNFTFANWSPSCQGDRQRCIQAIAVHEFGHALGFAHEQNRPDTPSSCNQRSGSNGDTTIGDWDLMSVMNYCNPEWNNNGLLSATDIQGLQRYYGGPGGGGGSCGDPGPFVNGYATQRCDNDGNAPIYASANRGQQVSTMYSTNSWFACWTHGAPHEGHNDIWYYTLGDSPAVWGYMPAINLHENNDPLPGLAQCGGGGGGGGDCTTNGPTVTAQGISYVSKMCGNTANAPLYSAPNRGQRVSTMHSTNSWFACWVHGAQHEGKNDIWYYTVGDDPNVWGYMPAVNLQENNDPIPGMAQCGGGGGGTGAQCTTDGPTVNANGTNYVTKTCGNDPNAPLYAGPSRGTKVSTMQSTNSWFACWVHGAPHEGKNDIWYYTKGDSPAAWGYMPAVNLHENNDPIPGMAQCNTGGGPVGQCTEIGPTVSHGGTSYVTRMCGNDANAPLYAAANKDTRVSVMKSTKSWFACWTHGAQHEGGNDIWYYTEGDSPNVWGYMPAANLHENNDPIPGMAQCGVAAPGVIDVPFVAQNPELPRGCEVTSLSMMLAHAGVSGADKMTLAAKVDKVPYLENGLHGNPNVGFVGNMYTFSEKGYGAYHAPIERLAEQYIPGRVVKLTGMAFDDILTQHVGKGRPVWIVTNAKFKPLPASSFETWHTSTGDVQITWNEHSVVITGYDDSTVFINDPLDPSGGKNKRLDRGAFRAAWEQMGNQAITYSQP